MTKKGSKGRKKSPVSVGAIVAGGTAAIALASPFSRTAGNLAVGASGQTIVNALVADAQNYWANLPVAGVVAPIVIYAAGRKLAGRVPIARGVVLF